MKLVTAIKIKIKTRYTSVTLVLFLFFVHVYAQETKQIAVETKNTSLLLTVNSTGKIFQSFIVTRSHYKILDRIREKYPHLPMMLCSGGGGRTDYGALKYFNEFRPSDNTDPVERIFIQWGYSYLFPSLSVVNQITSRGKQSLKFKTDVRVYHEYT